MIISFSICNIKYLFSIYSMTLFGYDISKKYKLFFCVDEKVYIDWIYHFIYIDIYKYIYGAFGAKTRQEKRI